MSDEFGPNFITITDEDGNDIELEYVDALEHNGVTYMAFFPTADTEEEAESAQDFGLVILKSVMENGEELLATPDTDEELNEVFDLFTQQLLEDEEEVWLVNAAQVMEARILVVLVGDIPRLEFLRGGADHHRTPHRKA